MREVQREHGRKDRGGPRFDDTRRPRGAGAGGYGRPASGGYRRDDSGGARGTGFRSDRGPRPDRDRGPRGGTGSGGFRPDRDRPSRPERPYSDRPRGGRFDSRPERSPRPSYDRGDQPDRFERPSRPTRSDGGYRPSHDRPGYNRPDRDRAGRTERHDRPNPATAGLGPPRPVPAPEIAASTRVRAALSGMQQTSALVAAYNLGFFKEIFRRPQSSDDVARTCGTDPHATRALLEALVAMTLLQRHGPTYVVPRDLAHFLVPGVDGDSTGWLDLAGDLYGAWGDLTRGVREGIPRFPLTGDDILNGDPSRVRRYIRSVHTGSRDAAGRVAQMAPLLPGSTLLDVGGGSGIFAATYARVTPDLKATLFDLAPTIEVARDILHAEGLENTIEYHPGDYRNDAFPGPVDAILLSNVFQTESEEHILGILRRAQEALRPGGTLLVHGVMTDSAPTPPLPIALFSLQMFLLFGEGRSWSVDQTCAWLAQERFGVHFAKPIGDPFFSTLILATRLE